MFLSKIVAFASLLSSLAAANAAILGRDGTTPPSVPLMKRGGVDCNGVQDWQADLAYTAGQEVIYNNQLYTAIQWTYDNAPPQHGDQWKLDGTCAPPIINTPDCNGVPAWADNVAYKTGAEVTYKGSLWSAVQWTYANTPGDTSGSWKDLGVCA